MANSSKDQSALNLQLIEELAVAKKELLFQAEEKAKRAAELAIANKVLTFQNQERGDRAAELVLANKELAYQNDEKAKRVDELVIANEEKSKRASELVIANKELLFQTEEKAKRVDELVIANEEKAKRAAELVKATKELAFRGNRRLMYLSGYGVILIIALLVSVSLLYLRQQAESRMIANSQILVKSLELMFVGQIETINVALLAVSKEMGQEIYHNKATIGQINTYLDLIRSGLPHADLIRATNAQGDILYGQDSPFRPMNIADRDYFQQLRDNPNLGMLIVHPLIGKLDLKARWPFAMRINKPDGSFGGVVFVSMQIDEIINMFGQVRKSSSSVIALRGQDMGLIARQANGDNSIATGDKKLSVQFREAFKANPVEGTYAVSSDQSIDGVSRIMSYRVNPKYHFLISDGIDQDIELAAWYRWVWISSGATLVIALGILLFLNLINKSWQREEHDIAKQNEADLKVAESEERFHKLVEDNKEVILQIDAENGHILDANEAACQFYGYSKTEFYTKNITALNQLSPDQVAAMYLTAAREERNDFIFPHRLASGEIRTVEVKSTPVKLLGKTVLISIIHDITERKKAEKALASQLANLKALLETASDGIHILDSTGKLTQYSHSFATMLGYTEEEIQGLNVRDWDAQIPQEQLVDVIQKLIQNPEVFQTQHRKKDGSIIDVEINAKGVVVEGKHYLYASARDITERKHLEEQISHMAYYDALTELPNRRLLKDRLGQAIASKKRSGHYGALMFIDLDNFKPLNDLHGHEAGDFLLIEVGKRIKDCVREMDTVARIGGDEFVALIGQLEGDEPKSINQAKMIADKIRLALAQPYSITIVQGRKTQPTINHHCTASIGVAVFSGKATDPEVILSMADVAMYEAKEAGRNRVRLNPVVI